MRLVDTRDWTLRTLHPGAILIHRAGTHLLATGPDTGLLAFDSQGRRRFSRFPGRDVSLLGSHGELAYVWVRRGRTLHVIDLASGRTLRTDPTPPARVPFLFSGA